MEHAVRPPGSAPAFVPPAGGTVPPPSVPLSFLAAAAIGLWAFGLAVWFAADRIVDAPTHPGAASAVHVGVLAFLTMAVLGALHQFAPVAGRRRLRSTVAARLTFVGMLATAWLLPTGLAHGPESLVLAGGIAGALTVSVAAWNLSGPLSSRDGGVPVAGLRLAVLFFVVTVAFGVVYAIDRQAGWFPLLPTRVLAHAHFGLLGWLGLTYVAVAEKLWPMFLLSHRPRPRAGAAAVAGLAIGVPVLAAGLLLDAPTVAWVGGVFAGLGLVSHLCSLIATVRHRRRPLELLHAFLFVSAAFLVVAMVLAVAAALGDVSPTERARLVAAEVAALVAWLALAVVGHAHKIVPFIGYSALRSRGIATGPTGKPLLFSDLYRHGVARVTFVVAVTGFTVAVAGILLASTTVLAVGGVAISCTGLLAGFNLGSGPRRARRAAARATPEPSGPPSVEPPNRKLSTRSTS